MLNSPMFSTNPLFNLDAKLYLKLSVILFPMLGLTFSVQTIAEQDERSSTAVDNYDEVTLDDVSSGTLLFQQAGSNRFLQAPQLKTTVDINIKGIVSNVKVKQKFTNTSDEWQHAVYAFPLPDNAAVNQLTIKVAKRTIMGVIQEKNKALKTFNNAKTQGKKAALVQQYRPNLFTTNIANIPPHESIEVELTYFQQVDYQAGEFSLHFPMAITPRYLPASSVNNPVNSLPELIYKVRNSSDIATELALQNEYSSIGKNQDGISTDNQLIDVNINLDAGAELAEVNSVNHSLIATHQVKQNNEGSGVYVLSLANQVMDKDFKLVWRYREQNLPQVVNFQQVYQEKNYGLLMVLPGLNEASVKTNRELTFVLDTSGSMSGQSLTQAKAAFNFALKSLKTEDSFQLISFNSYPTKLFQTPVLATKVNKQNAWDYVNKLTATGGTEIKSALMMALKEENNKNEKLQQVVFLTDGAVGNEAEVFSYIADNLNNKRLFTVGLGSAPNRYFMKKAAEIGRGSYQFISNHNQLAKIMQQLFNKLSNPVLTNLQLSLNDPNGQIVTTPSPIPDIYQDEPLFLSYQINCQQTDSLLSGMYKGKAWSLAIEGYEETVTDKSFMETINPESEEEIPPLSTLWARGKIADYFRELMLYKNEQSKTDIVNLALQYRLVTPFTSLVAVEQNASRPLYSKAYAKQLENNLPAGQKLPTTSLNWQWRLYFGLLLFATAILFMCIQAWRDSFKQVK